LPSDLTVLGQDPRFGGGGLAQTNAFLAAARELGREPALLYDPHPGLGDRRLTWRRVEALREHAAARRLSESASKACSLWVVSTLAQAGGAAPLSGHRYGCWIGTTIDAEWRGRAAGLSPLRRAAAAASIRTLATLERRVLHGAARVFTTSEASRAQVAAVAQRDVGILPIPVDFERFYPALDDEWREAFDRPVIAFTGRADDPRKNIGLLLTAFARLRERQPDALLRLIGRPPAGRVSPGVEAVGEVPDVAAELRHAGIFVMPSRQEGFGIAVAEALATGLPVVTTPCGGPEELVRNSNGGCILTSFDPDELADALETLDAGSMRAAGRDYVRRVHSPKRFRALLAEALDGI
jgi:glycosyltransferase involved in cell wall biosynthesis